MHNVCFGFGGVSFGRNGVERFHKGFKVTFGEDNKVIDVQVFEERAKVSDSEQEKNSK
ncbi:hypothetical protein [Ruminococcus sp.]|uniref:hypothetical protein n=1 Tax=Ruminococcus sp. TaxID=41978 RepID=UPI003EFE39B4